MTTLTTIFDTRNLEFNAEMESPGSCKDIAGYILTFHAQAWRMVGPILTNAQFTDIEYAVIFALMVWHINPSQNYPEHILSMCFSVRIRLFVALSTYYRDELRLVDYSVELGHVTLFEHAIQETALLLCKSLQTHHLTVLVSKSRSSAKEACTLWKSIVDDWSDPIKLFVLC
ncbi:hypothetical protein PENTCL1PPCAC_8017 [Pristionchus entomophagus]|uniref:NR LBD domain-containing protein n=1 Tax=Pristionchus entomophagus TaxID=358040 RepID=A0AAV5SR43_9BILA|nr:hypothetical protein PENTCL1PPCAC_8017 [Pristionchus entomophagus]